MENCHRLYEALRQKTRHPGPVVDMHVHPLRDTALFGVQDAKEDARKLLAAAQLFGITHLCVSSLGPGYPLEPDIRLCREANDYALKLRDHAPKTVLPFCYIIPGHREAAIQEIHRCIGEHQMVGIKLWVSQASVDELDAVVKCAIEYGVSLLHHAWLKTTGNLAGESTPHDVAVLARRNPRARFIMAHLYGANPRGLEAVRDLSNIFVDTSGGDPEGGMLELAVARLGVDRILFGSDAPGRHFGVSLAKVLGSRLSKQQKEAVLWNNAQKLLPPWALAGES